MKKIINKENLSDGLKKIEHLLIDSDLYLLKVDSLGLTTINCELPTIKGKLPLGNYIAVSVNILIPNY